jgi:hypothetical protein
MAVLKNAQTNEHHVSLIPFPFPFLFPRKRWKAPSAGAGVLGLRYRLIGRLENLLIPAAATAPERREGLWKELSIQFKIWPSRDEIIQTR